MILDIQGGVGHAEKTVQLQKAVTSADSIRLKYFHFPGLPLLDLFPAGVTVGGVAHDILPVSSIPQLVNRMDAITHNASRVFFCFYNAHEFELCTGGNAVTLSAGLAAVLKMGTTLQANSCYSSALFEGELSLYSHFAVQVGHTRGFWDGALHNETIARVRRDRDISTAHSHFFNSAITYLDFRVLAVKKDGTHSLYDSPEVWSAGLEVM